MIMYTQADSNGRITETLFTQESLYSPKFDGVKFDVFDSFK